VSLKAAAHAFPTLLRVGFAEAVAYRAELLVWVLATTMPLIMLALFSAVASEGPIGRFGQADFVAYFLATFIVRQLTGSWASWQMNQEVRDGTLAMRLLRPIPPLVSYAVENIAAVPMRVAVSLPIAIAWFVFAGTEQLAKDPVLWLIWCAALLGAWLISMFANFAVGSLSFFMESSVKVMEIWLALFFVASGYLIPTELFPGALRAVVDWLPFRYQLGFPVELMTGALGREEALALLARQWLFVVLLLGASLVLFRRGVARFAAYGG
jgi:ABC-2 type transport system permease protein